MKKELFIIAFGVLGIFLILFGVGECSPTYTSTKMPTLGHPEISTSPHTITFRTYNFSPHDQVVEYYCSIYPQLKDHEKIQVLEGRYSVDGWDTALHRDNFSSDDWKVRWECNTYTTILPENEMILEEI